MTQIHSNFYRSPLFSDGELLLKAKQLREELEKLWEGLNRLKNCNGCLSEIKQSYDRTKIIAKELNQVLDALEENCYDCSEFRM